MQNKRIARGSGSFFRKLGKAVLPATARLFLFCACTAGPPVLAAEVGVYSARKEILIRPLLDRFSEQTGIEVRLLAGKGDALLKRLELEGARTPADLFLTVDVGYLYRARQAGLLQPVHSPFLQQRLPAVYRDAEAHWYGLSLRARVIVYNRERVDPTRLHDYFSLSDPHWRGRVCVRSSSNVYNQSLVAALIVHHGTEAVENWARGLVANLAHPPQGGDRDQIRAIYNDRCDLALVNTYYLGGMLHSEQPEEMEAARGVDLFWPDQSGHGVHINLSGAGITRHAKHPQEAQRLLEFLLSDEAQRWSTVHNYEYPVVGAVKAAAVLQTWGIFQADTAALDQLGENNAEAVRLMDRAGWR